MGETFVFGKYRYCTYCKIFNYIIVHAVGWNEAGGWKEPGSLHQIRQNRHVASQPPFVFPSLPSYFLHFDTLILQRIRIIVGDAGFKVQTRNLFCPRSLVRYQWATTSPQWATTTPFCWDMNGNIITAQFFFLYYRERESTGIILQNNFKFTICPQEYIFCFPFYVYFFLHTIFAYISVSVSLNKNTHKKGAFSHLKIIE